MHLANPYAAPTTLQRRTGRGTSHRATAQESAAAMYSPSQIAAATFLGGMTAGGILMAGNAFRRGRAAEAACAVVGGVVATCAVVALAFSLPFDVPGMLFLAMSTLVMWGIAQAAQGTEYNEHVAGGGATAKGWKPVLIAVLTGVVMGGAIFAVVMTTS